MSEKSVEKNVWNECDKLFNVEWLEIRTKSNQNTGEESQPSFVSKASPSPCPN